MCNHRFIPPTTVRILKPLYFATDGITAVQGNLQHPNYKNALARLHSRQNGIVLFSLIHKVIEISADILKIYLYPLPVNKPLLMSCIFPKFIVFTEPIKISKNLGMN